MIIKSNCNVWYSKLLMIVSKQTLKILVRYRAFCPPRTVKSQFYNTYLLTSFFICVYSVGNEIDVFLYLLFTLRSLWLDCTQVRAHSDQSITHNSYENTSKIFPNLWLRLDLSNRRSTWYRTKPKLPLIHDWVARHNIIRQRQRKSLTNETLRYSVLGKIINSLHQHTYSLIWSWSRTVLAWNESDLIIDPKNPWDS